MRRDVDKAHLCLIHLLENPVRLLQLEAALLQMVRHLVEGAGEHADLVLALDLGPLVQIAAGNGS